MGYIYKITNKINNKVYIGKTEGDIALRWQQHIYNMSNGIEYHLYNAMRKYGLENFSFILPAIIPATLSEILFA